MLYCLLIHCMALILLIQVHYSKSVDSNTEVEEHSETNSEDLGLDDNVGIHVSYRPKHKYKFGNIRDTLKRFTERDSKTESDDDNPKKYAIMFKNNEPVGILQPSEESYRFLPISGESTFVELNPVPLKKKKSVLDIIKPSESNSETNEDKSDNKVGFMDDRYPAILAKFKIDSRVAANRHNMLKRATESTDITDSQLSSLKSTMAKVRSDDNVFVEEELKNILDDMGLIDDYPLREEKREVAENENEDLEDENLEIGTNKINLLKENPKDLREKREFANEDIMEESTFTNEPVDKLNNAESSEEPVAISNENPVEKRFCPTKTTTVGEEDNLKKKRENNNADVSENDLPIQTSTLRTATEDPYDTRIEREIRDKIRKLKEEVKQEIADISNAKTVPPSDDSRREKRQIVTNLFDEETEDIDPVRNDMENSKIHIRRKRDLSYEEDFAITSDSVPSNEGTEGTIKIEIPIPINKRRKRSVNNDDDYDKVDIEGTVKDRSVEGNGIRKETIGDIASQDTAESNSNILDQSNFIFQPLLFAKRTCVCKNGNCKCGKTDTKGKESSEKDSGNAEIISESDFNLSESQNGNLNEEEEDMKEFDKDTNEENSQKLRAPRKTEGFHFTDGEYFIDQHPPLFQLTPVEEVEGKDHLVPLKTRSDSDHRLYTIKRSMIPHSRFRRRTQTENNEPMQLIDMSAEELFGALPQSYEGELARYKRVKRSRLKN